MLFGDDIKNRIKLLQASNNACKVNITPDYQQNYNPNFSRTQDNRNNFRKNNFNKTSFKKDMKKPPSNYNRGMSKSSGSSTEIRETGKGYTPVAE